MNEEGVNVQPVSNEKPIILTTDAPKKETPRDKINNYLVTILCIASGFIGLKYPAVIVIIVLILLITYATYYCFKPINISISDYTKTRRFSFLFVFLGGVTLPLISGGLGGTLSHFGVMKYLTEDTQAIIQTALVLFYWILIGPLIVKRNLSVISTLLVSWIVWIIALLSIQYFRGRLSSNYLEGLVILSVICIVLAIVSVWISKRYIVRTR